MQEFEGIPLGKIQHISHHAGQLFDILFSMHFEDATENRLWKLIDTSTDLPPDVCALVQPDYFFSPSIKCILACEIAANVKADSLTMTVVFRETDVSAEEVDQAFGSFNSSLHDLRPNKRRRGTRPPPVLTRLESSSSGLATPGGDHPISRIVCDFLGVSSDHCGPTTSLLSLGLDSIKAVSLSRKLRNEGFSISASTIMRFPSLRKIRSHVAAEASPAKSPGATPIPISPENEVTVEPLHPDDKVQLYFATALQNGMLSKVRATLYSFIDIFTHISTDHCVWRCSLFSLLRAGICIIA
jgi:aryl carrier-like protein